MKRLTLNKTWKLCLAMWRWIAGQRKKGNTSNVDDLKEEWLNNHGFEDEEIDSCCFFCEYHSDHPLKIQHGCNCPAVKIDKTFDCMDDDYHYRRNPIAFYNKLVSLNRKRLKK